VFAGWEDQVVAAVEPSPVRAAIIPEAAAVPNETPLFLAVVSVMTESWELSIA